LRQHDDKTTTKIDPSSPAVGLCAVFTAGSASLSILGKLAINADLNIVTILSLRYAAALLLTPSRGHPAQPD
jgi:hypothetical protein